MRNLFSLIFVGFLAIGLSVSLSEEQLDRLINLPDTPQPSEDDYFDEDESTSENAESSSAAGPAYGNTNTNNLTPSSSYHGFNFEALFPVGKNKSPVPLPSPATEASVPSRSARPTEKYGPPVTEPSVSNNEKAETEELAVGFNAQDQNGDNVTLLVPLDTILNDLAHNTMDNSSMSSISAEESGVYNSYTIHPHSRGKIFLFIDRIILSTRIAGDLPHFGDLFKIC